MVLGVEHLVGTGETGLLHHPGMETADGDNARQHVRLFAGVGLVEHPLIAGAVGAGLVGVDAGDDEEFVLHLILHGDQTVDIVHHAVLAVGGAGADDQHQPSVPAVQNGAHLLHPGQARGGDPFRQGELLFDLHGDGQFANEPGVLPHI